MTMASSTLMDKFGATDKINFRQLISETASKAKKFSKQKAFCTLVFYHMNKCSLSMETLAQLMECSVNELHLVLNGEEHCTPERIKRLQEIFNLPYPIKEGE